MATYKDELPDNFALHYATEPFDYRDGDHGISNVYSTIKKHKPKTRIYVSTYFPEDVEDEMCKLVSEMIKNSVDHNLLKETLRISIRQPGKEARRKERERILKRLETVRGMVEANLTEDKYKKEIDSFFEENIDGLGFGGLTVTLADKQRQSLHKALDRSPTSKDVMQTNAPITPSDGIVLGPNGFRAIAMDALSVMNPTGLTEWPVEPGDGFSAPIKQEDHYATEYGNVYSFYLKYRGNFPEVLIPRIRLGANSEDGERVVVKERMTLSREIRAFRTMLQTYQTSSEYLKQLDDGFLLKLYGKIRQEYGERRYAIKAALENDVPEEQRFYIEPATLYLKLLDRIFADVDTRLRNHDINGVEIVDVFANAATLKSQQIREMK
jgi:hypothetical protein